jgi:hypothetical protein
MKDLEHRSQAERLALAEALEATFGEEADTGVYISSTTSPRHQELREPRPETD